MTASAHKHPILSSASRLPLPTGHLFTVTQAALAGTFGAIALATLI